MGSSKTPPGLVHFRRMGRSRGVGICELTLYASLLSSLTVSVPMTRVKPPKNHSTTELMESEVGILRI